MFCGFLTVPWVGLRYVIVVFSDHTHLLFSMPYKVSKFIMPLFYEGDSVGITNVP